MADAPTYKSIGEKFKAITEGKRQRPGMIWVANPAMDVDGSGNFTLIEVVESHFNAPKSAYKEQGYVKYVHVNQAPAPVEAKAVKTDKN